MPDYEFYTTVYHGLLQSDVFTRLLVKAAAYLSAATLNKSNRTDLPENVRNAVKITLCALVDEMHKAECGGDVVSESNDGISRAYAANKQQTDAEKLSSVVYEYLAWTGLLYRGCCF